MKKNKTMSPALPDPEKYRGFVRPLLDWYGKNGRILPWRSASTPYRVWVSEIMLQQTRVEAVIPYFESFLAAFPDIPALAAADDDRLAKCWEGLGYYSRVRNMHKAALKLAEMYHMQLPGSFEQLLGLPGIGEYTAGAIASIAFGQPVAAVDGNVLRVFSRLLANGSDVSDTAVRRALRLWLGEILPKDRPGDFNQAVMDLGAMICLPGANPKCERCPLAALCLARGRGEQGKYPVKPPKPARKKQRKTVLLILSDRGVLLHRRPDKGLLAGMWEFPNTDGAPEQAALFACGPIAFLNVTEGGPLPDGRHIFTHIEWEMQGRLFFTADADAPSGYVWADREALLTEYAIPSAFGVYLRALLAEPRFASGRDSSDKIRAAHS